MNKKEYQKHPKTPTINTVCDGLGFKTSNILNGLYNNRPLSQKRKDQLAEEYMRQASIFAQYLKKGE